jgi:hypothetical protein
MIYRRAETVRWTALFDTDYVTDHNADRVRDSIKFNQLYGTVLALILSSLNPIYNYSAQFSSHDNGEPIYRVRCFQIWAFWRDSDNGIAYFGLSSNSTVGGDCYGG